MSKTTVRQDAQDVVVVDITLKDKKGREVPDACPDLMVAVDNGLEILGWGNGDPGFKADERPLGDNKQRATVPAFMGKAQVILRATGAPGDAQVRVSLPKAKEAAAAKVRVVKLFHIQHHN